MIALILLATTIYLLLTIAALLSTVCPPLKSISLHGKARLSNYECNTTHHYTAGIFRRLRFLLSGLTVNKIRFIDFYAAGIITTLLVVYANIAPANTYSTPNSNHWFLPNNFSQWLHMVLLLLHLIRRYCECKWVQKSDRSSQMHLAGYLVGILHYLCLPFVFLTCTNDECTNDENGIPLDCIQNIETESNGSCNVASSFCGIQYKSMKKLVDIIAITGCMYFQYEQHRHHVILANLRSTKKPAFTYSLPTGGWFEYVSSPHYLSEIMIYFTFVILLNNASGSLRECDARAQIVQWDYLNISTAYWRELSRDTCVTVLTAIFRSKHWLLLAWVVTNLSISANRTHNWYLHNFGAAYPQHRKRLVPFAW